jgi:rSAM/selenodomain-associated transferase 2/rSAM/selenodomain-associated transferase 1
MHSDLTHSARFSVIVPALNEAPRISECIREIRKLDPGVEIIVADGCSTDDTFRIASGQGAVVCSSGRGRGPQCNAGAALACGEILVFLHADTRLPENAFPLLDSVFRDEKVQLGVFKLSFDVHHWLLNLYPLLLRLNLPHLRFGDQCIVVCRSFFQFLGGFPDCALFEDSGLARKASRHTRIRIFPATVVTSARRFIRNGVVRQLLRNTSYLFRYLLGADPDELAAKYSGASQRDSTALISLAREPEPGKVKTRLSADIGADNAAGVYRICANTAFRAMRKVRGDLRRYIFFAPGRKGNTRRIRIKGGPDFYYAEQNGKDLGERLAHAFRTAFRNGADRAVAIGTDVPDIDAETIAQAIDSLKRYDTVIGPSPDGGYYLVGMNRLHEDMFRHISWSSEFVLAQTRRTIDRLGLSCHLLPELADIDTKEALLRWKEHAYAGHPLYRFVKKNLEDGDGFASPEVSDPKARVLRPLSCLARATRVMPPPGNH